MAYFKKLRDCESRFDKMSVDELSQWKAYWTQHAQGLAPKVKKPLCLSFGRVISVESIQIGDDLLQYRNGKIRTVKVQAIEMTDRHEDVLNLILNDAVFFVANNFVARSKPPAESGQQEIADHRHSPTVKK